MQVTVQVSADVARALHHRGSTSAASIELLSIIETFNLALEPMHPDTDDSSLQSFFVVEAQDSTTAQRIIDHLQELEAVEAAYIKPPDEQP